MHSFFLFLIVVQCVYSVAATRQRCSSPRFSCQFNNPCDPLCVGGQFYYPGRSDSTYVQCVNGECTEQRCPRRTTWNQGNLRCEGGNGLEARCAFGAFDCDDHNPCQPTLCEQGVDNYPGPSPRRYVSCEGGCSEELCPRRQVWDQDAQRCVRKNRSSGSCTLFDLIHYAQEFSHGALYTSDYTTLEQCIDGCLADVNCYGIEWHYSLYSCYIHYEQSTLDTRYSDLFKSQYVKPPACF